MSASLRDSALFTQSTTFRFTFAVLALLGQVIPAVVAPAFAATCAGTHAGTSGCAPASCACPITERAAGRCCSLKSAPTPLPKLSADSGEDKPTKAKRKKCCSEEHPPETLTPEQKVVDNIPVETATLTSVDKCSCDRPQTAMTAASEPAVSPSVELPMKWFVGLVLRHVPAAIAAHFCLCDSPQPPPPKA